MSVGLGRVSSAGKSGGATRREGRTCGFSLVRVKMSMSMKLSLAEGRRMEKAEIENCISQKSLAATRRIVAWAHQPDLGFHRRVSGG